MKHTQGNWEIVGKQKDSIISRRMQDNKPVGYTIIASTPILSTNAPFTDEERYANAKLIAAAPELLQCLKQFIHSVEHEGEIHGRIVDAVNNAKAAISKATL